MATFRESASIHLKYQGVLGLLLFLVPVRRVKGQWFVMRPTWRGPQFSWRSINKARF